jgi:hypothetical protein
MQLQISQLLKENLLKNQSLDDQKSLQILEEIILL